jgi:hemolysin activation/secretion protein
MKNDPPKSDLPGPSAESPDDTLIRIAKLERELQFAKLDLEETQSQLIAVQHDLKLQNQQAADLRDIEISGKLNALFRDLSSPLVQLLTQNHIQHIQGKSLKTKDIDSTINRLVQSLKSHGLTELVLKARL